MSELIAKVTKRGDIIIRIPGGVLRTALRYSEEMPEGSRVTNTAVFAKEVVWTFMDEDEVGESLLTRMIDDAMNEAVEQGCEGVKLGDDDDD